MAMLWEKLLSLDKYKSTHRTRNSEDESRVGFEVDYDRVIFSSEFRSLQDKTQVIPLSQTDFVHTRLTHSMEVSVVGRSLGRSVGKTVLERHSPLKGLGYKIIDFGNIVASASLAHDIGNPPFGHGGEKAFGVYFSERKDIQSLLTEKQYKDLCSFEGNANGFKILTQSRRGVSGGFRLTYATLGAFVKYPKESLPEKPTDKVYDKKYGFFQSEKETFLDIAESLGLKSTSTKDYISFARHPLVYLVEAADDICYSIIDFEDGVNLGFVTEHIAEECLMSLVKNRLDYEKYKLLDCKEDRIGYLRAVAISVLIKDVISVFLDYEKDILNHSFTCALLDRSLYASELNEILKISKKLIYQSTETVEKEIAGYNILKKILNDFVTAYINHTEGKATSYNQLILLLLPKKYLIETDLYSGLISICTFIAGLSDSKVVMLHKKIIGISW